MGLKKATNLWSMLPVAPLQGYSDPSVFQKLQDAMKGISDQIDYLRGTYGGQSQFVTNITATAPITVTTTTGGASTIALTNPLAVQYGGTGLASGTSGGILGFTASGTIASSSALTQNALVLGGGAGATPSTPVGLGTTTTVLHGNPSGAPSWGAVSLTTDVSGILPLNAGGTNANLTASNGGIFYSTGSAGAILPGTATANQVLLSGSSSAPTWSTATYPATTTANQILYSSATNQIAGLATANNGVLITSGGGVPSIGSTLPSAVQLNITQLGTVTSGTWNASLIPLAYGGTNANLTASNGGIFYSTASAGAILSGTATAGLALVSGASTTPSWFTPTAGSVVYAGTGGALAQDNSNFWWDATNHRLGIGTNNPLNKSVVAVSATATGYQDAGAMSAIFNTNDAVNSQYFGLSFTQSNTPEGGIQKPLASITALSYGVSWNSNWAGRLAFSTAPGGANATPTIKMLIDESGNVGIGTNSPQQKLDVVGAIAISGTTAIDSSRNYSGGTGTFVGLIATTANNTLAFRALSTDNTKYTYCQIGRASADGTWAAVQATDSWLTGAIAGDFALRAEGASNFVILGANGAGSAKFGASSVQLLNNANLGINGSSYGTGTGVIFIANASVNPTTNPSGGGILYCSGGALVYRGSSGTVTTIANS